MEQEHPHLKSSFLLKRLFFLGKGLFFSVSLFLSFSLEAYHDALLHSLFKERYAPKEWKKALFSWDLEERIKLFTLTSEEKGFKPALLDFVSSLSDLHTTVRWMDMGTASLPIEIVLLEGHFFLSWKDSTYPFLESLEVGDELLFWEGAHLSEISEKVRQSLGWSKERVHQIFLTSLLTKRFASMGMVLPSETEVKLTFQKEDGPSFDVQIPWIHTGFNDQIFASFASFSEEIEEEELFETLFFSKEMYFSKDLASFLSNEASWERDFSYQNLELGKVLEVLEEGLPFSAYLFGLEKSSLKGGYFRLKGFKADKKTPFWMKKARQTLYLFQEKSDFLVIDLRGNQGGSVITMLSLLGSLSDYPIENLLQIESVSMKEYLSAESFLNNSAKNSQIVEKTCYLPQKNEIWDEGLASYARYIIDLKNEGKIISDPYPIFGVDKIPALEKSYKKPLVVLIDEKTVSAGELMAALLKEGRVESTYLIGVTTAGAGGMVSSEKFFSDKGVSEIRFTTSLVFSQDGTPLENIGVSPHVAYEFSKRDLLSDGILFQKFLEEFFIETLSK